MAAVVTNLLPGVPGFIVWLAPIARLTRGVRPPARS